MSAESYLASLNDCYSINECKLGSAGERESLSAQIELPGLFVVSRLRDIRNSQIIG